MVDTSHVAVLSSKGQIVIPKNIRDALGLREGDRLGIGIQGLHVVLFPVPQPSKPKPAGE